jgi:flagellum-specific peptidoglycan hydrolase FlgJ
MVAAPFVWGPGGSQLTPEEIAKMRAFEDEQMAGAIDTSPVGHWTQGLARVANAAAGAYRRHKLGKASEENASYNSGLMKNLFGSNEFPAAPSASSSPSSGGPVPSSGASQVAPAPTVDISGSKETFVQSLLPAAIEESKRTGVDPRIIVAQAAQETGWGRSAPGNNYFGIKSHGKGGGQNLTTHEVINGKRVKINDSFRTFESPADSVRGYGDFILQNPRYTSLRNADGLDAQLEALQASGYATDPNYSRSVGAIARGIQLPDLTPAPEAQAAPIMDPLAYNEQTMRMSPDLAGPEPSAAQAVNAMATGGQMPIPGIQHSGPTMQDMAGRMPEPTGQPMAQGMDGIISALQQQQAAPPMAPPREVEQMQVAQAAPQQPSVDPQALAQAIRNRGGNPDIGILPVLMGEQGQTNLSAQPAQPNPQELLQVMADPRATDQTKRIAQILYTQQVEQQQAERERQIQSQDPLRQLQVRKAQIELERLQSGGGVDPAKVQSSVVLDDGSTVMVMSDGKRRVLSATGDELSGQSAADAIKAARAYEVENQREIYGGRREGTLGADIRLGGEAQAAKDVASATVKTGVSAWEDYAKLQSSIGTIGEAISAIDAGAQSGVVYKYLPDITEASASLNNAMNRMGLDVIGSVTFGALSEGEMRLAMETAVPRNLAPAELRSWLVKKQAAQQKASDMLADAAQYMTTPGNTINGWIVKNRAMKKAQPDAQKMTATGESGGIPEGIDPEDWKYMSPEDRALFQ